MGALQLSLHKNKVAVGLLPPVLGTLIGIVTTSPIWLPATLLVGVMGFPLWFVVGLATSLVLVFAAISTLVTVQVVRSARLKAAVDGFLRSPQGQLLLFQGSESNQGLAPAEFAAKLQQYVIENPSHKLLASLVIDFLGTATFAVPVVGELADILWAPVSAKLVSELYSESSPRIKYLAFMEELLPFTDIIPTATLAWYVRGRRAAPSVMTRIFVLVFGVEVASHLTKFACGLYDQDERELKLGRAEQDALEPAPVRRHRLKCRFAEKGTTGAKEMGREGRHDTFWKELVAAPVNRRCNWMCMGGPAIAQRTVLTFSLV